MHSKAHAHAAANVIAEPAKTYRLKFLEDASGISNYIEFEAEDAARALVVAHKEAYRRSAELWCEGRKLCTIKRQGEGVWKIN